MNEFIKGYNFIYDAIDSPEIMMQIASVSYNSDSPRPLHINIVNKHIKYNLLLTFDSPQWGYFILIAKALGIPIPEVFTEEYVDSIHDKVVNEYIFGKLIRVYKGGRWGIINFIPRIKASGDAITAQETQQEGPQPEPGNDTAIGDEGDLTEKDKEIVSMFGGDLNEEGRDVESESGNVAEAGGEIHTQAQGLEDGQHSPLHQNDSGEVYKNIAGI